MRKKYETDITDEQWEVIKPLFVNMRKYKWEKRELVDAVLYLVKTGCQWRNLPHDFPPVFTVQFTLYLSVCEHAFLKERAKEVSPYNSSTDSPIGRIFHTVVRIGGDKGL